jgi:hypothetical protein
MGPAGPVGPLASSMEALLRKLESWPVRHPVPAAGLAAVLLLILVMITPVGCGATVRPPAQVNDPVQVYLVDHGRTAGLVLPRPEGGMARYVFGDWRWYALGRQNLFLNGIPAMLWPTRSGLGRELLDVPAPPDDPESVRQVIDVVVQRIYPLTVERELAAALQSRLDAHFEERADELVHNPDHALTFVPYPERYSYFWNSNHKVASWLEELGCEVRGLTFNSIWTIRD